MLNFDRKYLSHPGKDPAAIHDLLMQQALFNVEYLIKGRHPDEIVAESPKLPEARDAVFGFGGGLHSGRPYACHQQAAKRNALRAWSAIDAPLLVVHSEIDQFESRAAADVVVEAVNHLRPGTATLMELEGLGHSFYRYGSRDEAYKRENREPAGELVADTILDWLSDVRRN